MSEYILEVEDVNKYFMLGETRLQALNSISLKIKQGEFTAIVGPSGSGKSTLLHIAAGLDKPSSGKVKLLGKDLQSLSDKQLARERNEKMGFIFQTFNLIPVLNVFENVEYPCLIYPGNKTKRSRIDELLDELGIKEQKKKKPNQLSGGQRQRVAIARALVNEPIIVFADEPTANLDHATGEGIMQIMQRMNKKYNATFIFSTHDPKIMDKASRIIRLEDGNLQGAD